MTKYFLMLAAALVLAGPVTAKAEEAAKIAAANIKQPLAAKLTNGTIVVIENDKVAVLNDDNTKKPAPDGEHALVNGMVIKSKSGNLVR